MIACPGLLWEFVWLVGLKDSAAFWLARRVILRWRHHSWRSLKLKLMMSSIGLLFLLSCNSSTYELFKFVDWDVLKPCLCIVSQYPSEDIFVSVKFALLIGNIVRMAGLLVKLRQTIGCLFEWVLQGAQMHFGTWAILRLRLHHALLLHRLLLLDWNLILDIVGRLIIG